MAYRVESIGTKSPCLQVQCLVRVEGSVGQGQTWNLKTCALWSTASPKVDQMEIHICALQDPECWGGLSRVFPGS